MTQTIIDRAVTHARINILKVKRLLIAFFVFKMYVFKEQTIEKEIRTAAQNAVGIHENFNTSIINTLQKFYPQIYDLLKA